MNHPHTNPRSALARVFPAFARPSMSLDGRALPQSTQQKGQMENAMKEPGAPPAARAIRPLPSAQKSNKLTPTSKDMPRPRLGQISFANCLPIFLPIERNHVTIDAEIVMDSPSRLNSLFEDGKLDMGSISSYYFLTRDNLTLLPHLSISCRGAVGSVLFFSKKDPSQVRGARIVTSAQSATSVNLLKVLFAEQYGFIPEMVSDSRPDLDSDSFAGALVIGDRALEVDDDWSQRFYRKDLGEWWYQRYEVPMVFGVWAARADWVDKFPFKFAEISSALNNAKILGLTRRWKDTLHEARRRTGLSLSRLERYYKNELNFDFQAAHSDGLALYQQLLKQHGLLEVGSSHAYALAWKHARLVKETQIVGRTDVRGFAGIMRRPGFRINNRIATRTTQRIAGGPRSPFRSD